MNAAYPLQQAICPMPKRLILWALIILLSVGALNLLISHAETKHGEDAVAVRQCLSGGNELQLWTKGNRMYRVCQISDSRFGIQVLEKIDNEYYEITSFVKEKMHTINKVMHYLDNCGATRVR